MTGGEMFCGLCGMAMAAPGDGSRAAAVSASLFSATGIGEPESESEPEPEPEPAPEAQVIMDMDSVVFRDGLAGDKLKGRVRLTTQQLVFVTSSSEGVASDFNPVAPRPTAMAPAATSVGPEPKPERDNIRLQQVRETNMELNELSNLGIKLWLSQDELRFDADESLMTEQRMSWLKANKADIVTLLKGTEPEPEPAPEPEPEPEPRWVRSAEAPLCMVCRRAKFGMLTRKHHCRRCGAAACDNCSSNSLVLERWLEDKKPHALRVGRSPTKLRVCDTCWQAEAARAERLRTAGRRKTGSNSSPLSSTAFASAAAVPGVNLTASPLISDQQGRTVEIALADIIWRTLKSKGGGLGFGLASPFYISVEAHNRSNPSEPVAFDLLFGKAKLKRDDFKSRLKLWTIKATAQEAEASTNSPDNEPVATKANRMLLQLGSDNKARLSGAAALARADEIAIVAAACGITVQAASHQANAIAFRANLESLLVDKETQGSSISPLQEKHFLYEAKAEAESYGPTYGPDPADSRYAASRLRWSFKINGPGPPERLSALSVFL
jgi:hypothetical protein